MNNETRKPIFTPDEFAHLGGGEIAYVTEIEAKQAIGQFPAAAELPPKARLFVLHAADGTPILIGDDRNAVIADALEQDLSMVPVH